MISKLAHPLSASWHLVRLKRPEVVNAFEGRLVFTKKPGTAFHQFENPSRSRQLEFSESANKDREAVEVPLPVSMHTGQIIMLTKILTATDLRFNDFEAGVPVHRWLSGPAGLS
jgi:hypothetical protein